MYSIDLASPQVISNADPTPKGRGRIERPQESIEVILMKKMDRINVGAMIFCLCLVAATALSSAKADDWNNKTVMTFDAPVEVPECGRADSARRHVRV
jgi:hypothetical protein